MSNINKILDPNSRMVSGPLNVVRLEGNFYGIKKVLYLFMDYHADVSDQTQCENIFSEDVQKYFAKTFYKLNDSNKIYDFFLEVFPTEIAQDIYSDDVPEIDHKEMYIEEVVKLFKKLFRYDPKKNRVLMNNITKNIRLHYIDIRDYYKNNVHNRTADMNIIARNFMVKGNIKVSQLNKIIKLMKIIRNHLEEIVEILEYSPKNNKSQRSKIIKTRDYDDLDIQTIEYLARKIKSTYKYQDVKKIMNMLLQQSIDNFKSTIKNIDESIKIFTNYAKQISESTDKLVRDPNTSYVYVYGLSPYTIRNMIVDIANRVDKIMDEQLIEFFARFTDIFFLRRFLDKDYITNGIIYTGALHSNTYINVLVKYFDFKVTHFSYSKISNPQLLTSEIKKRSLMEIQELILPNSFGQCSDMNSFPKEFQ
ncbi:hypothetical protein [Acanthamoeba castellanii mimivirus]|uniref:Uncharacterized protein R706 n=5 Tax=Mimivirus TaxID=315393 RepID=YR706_MIMIV|nr:hypothetical protein MIMI_gp0764 [Acanthamoeba polyphaga mimivirus]Q5UNW2.1 RecName: Full=Uncharacterized protein R706 [Acanthamoeba polyphaga mimivirus]AHA45128.1 hypothetical protein HIRU_S222 [Hirudovirus strain Sangsue]AHJ40330.1 hypothetical protein [Samba virus]ALR84329.1 hypothetical protein [Niemeyer virus]AMZ03150.1 hypothetical protein [Mimivirus Bombay]QTF49644.1 hypothetical protein [Mimivirus reunion]WMV62087.1 hypothetical protein qu_753 [Mimivirus sp.]BAV61837.1 hypothetic